MEKNVKKVPLDNFTELNSRKCPKCESGKVLKIVYGLPADDAFDTNPDLYEMSLGVG